VVIEEIRTERLSIQALDIRHAQAMLEYFERNREHLRRWEPERAEEFYTLAFQQSVIERAREEEARGAGMRFIVFEDGSEEIVAAVNLSNIRRSVIHAAVMGYSVDEQRQGRGYATEAAGAVVEHAFQTLNLHRLETSYQPENTASGRVLRKLGFAVEGYARDYLFINGTWRDAILVGLVNPGWSAAK
jgi:ribosomal-protein-alanine N-acetyltransferase